MYSDQDNSYHSHYSEENVYKLAFKYKNQIFDHDGHCESFVVFISNDNKHVPMWKQRVSPNPDQPVLWDYHVIFVIRTDDEVNVIDLDSTLGYRVPFDQYVKETFRPEFPLTNPAYKQMFRVIPADDYLDFFVSDRSHMIDQTKAYPPVYKQAPPPWPTIIGSKAGDCEMNAHQFISMHNNEAMICAGYFGKVMPIEEFMKMGNRGNVNVKSVQMKTGSAKHDNIGSAKMAEVPLLV